MSGLRLRIGEALDCDVAIVGAGPAGAAAAIWLVRAGLRPLLIDACAFPRDKVCGDFVGPAALRELQALGVAESGEYRDSNIIHGAALFLDGQELIASLIPALPGLPAHGRVVPRLRLDHWLFKAARAHGVPALERHRLRSYESDRNGVSLRLEGPDGPRRINAKALIGADGSASLVARRLRGHADDDEDRIVAVRAYYEAVSGPYNRCDLYFGAASFPGYYWLFPTGPSTANVGLGMLVDTLPPSPHHLRSLMLDLVDSDPALRARLGSARMTGKIAGWPLATYQPADALTGDRVLLAGDAAGLINPLNGEGIQYALLSGRWAAEVLAECAASDDFSAAALARYARRVRRELDFDMALARLIVQLIRNRALNPLWLQMLRVIVARARVDPAYADITGGVLAGLVPAARVLETDVVLATVKQALLSGVFGAVRHTLRGPRHLGALALDGADLAAGTAALALREPPRFARWGFGVGTAGVALAGRYATHGLGRLLSAPTMSPLPAVRAVDPPGQGLRLNVA